jgi:hypothetical protein
VDAVVVADAVGADGDVDDAAAVAVEVEVAVEVVAGLEAAAAPPQAATTRKSIALMDRPMKAMMRLGAHARQ